MWIYKITNIINNKIYIGLTTEGIYKRFNRHIRDSLCKNGKKYYLHNSINKWGKNSFKVEEICSCPTLDDLKIAERFYIKLYNTTDRNVGYNISEGGEGTIGVKKSEYTKNLIKQKALLRRPSERCLKALVDWSKSKVWTEEDREIIRENSKKTRKPVIQIDDLGNHIREFESVKSAARYHGITHGVVSRAITNKSRAANFRWKFKYDTHLVDTRRK